MITALVDTSILIDILRAYPPALAWIREQRGTLGVAPIVWLEMLEGAENKADQLSALRLLKQFERITLTDANSEWAIQSLLKFYLSHHVDAFDCLIAASAIRLNLPLYTRNIKHFRPLLGAQAIQPY